MFIAVLAEKGGVGKTTIATNLAGMRAGAGRRVLLLDADRQGASYAWAQARAKDSSLARVSADAKYAGAFRRYVSSTMRRDRYDDVLIDLGQGDSAEMDAALRAVDCAVIPVRPQFYDVRTMTLINKRVEQAREVNPSLRALMVMNQVFPNPRNRDTQIVRDLLERTCRGVELVVTCLHSRVGFGRAGSYGKTIEEYAQSGDRGIAEVVELYEQVFAEPYASSECVA